MQRVHLKGARFCNGYRVTWGYLGSRISKNIEDVDLGSSYNTGHNSLGSILANPAP